MYQKYCKRALDVLFALLLLPLVLFIIAICGFFIWLEDHGSIFYCSERLGRNQKIFYMRKLRSMKINAADLRREDCSAICSANDKRLTKTGEFLRRTSIDELPQIFNVLAGEMSFIGPRPDLPEALNCYTAEELGKLRVRPGISGLSQVLYRNSISQKQKFELDLYYTEHISFKMDVRIFVATLLRVFGQTDIYKD
jgi:lipopolysaccharide/colanic/teichoic acid biosynthesis glycosyltransferase